MGIDGVGITKAVVTQNKSKKIYGQDVPVIHLECLFCVSNILDALS